MPARLRPTAPIATDAVLVGDPGRALLLAQELLEQPRMCNHARGLWGYSGETAAGAELTVQSTGMGGPSAALVLADLAELGLRRAIRVGTGTGLDPGAAAGDLIVVREAWSWPSVEADTTAARRPDPEPTAAFAHRPDPELTAALAGELGAAGRLGTAASLDSLHPAGAQPGGPGEVADMQTATLLERGRKLGVVLAAVLIVAESSSGEALDDEGLATAAKRAGAAAALAVSNL